MVRNVDWVLSEFSKTDEIAASGITPNFVLNDFAVQLGTAESAGLLAT
jgi:hypothetical protein